MCQIIYKPETGLYEQQQVELAIKMNSDSVGIINLDTMEVFKFIEPDIMPVLEVLENMSSFVLHARYATNGSVSLNNCHPIKVNDNYYMHNGVLGNTKVLGAELLDSSVFVEASYPLIETAKASSLRFAMVEQLLGYNKLVQITQAGEVTIFNENLGEWFNGCWYSAGYDSMDWGHTKNKGKKSKAKSMSSYYDDEWSSIYPVPTYEDVEEAEDIVNACKNN